MSRVSNLQAIPETDGAEPRVDEIARNLRPAGGGLWTASASADLSYPEEGHAQCFEIEEGSFWFTHRNEVISDVMSRFPPSGVVFDIGGGNGFVTAGLIGKGFDAVLVEPGIEGARNAIRRGLSPVICSTLDEAGFAPQSLPAVGLFDVVEHIEDDRGFFEKVRAVLTPGGRLYATVPTLAWLWSVDDERAGHYRRYTVDSFSRVVAASGFTVEYATAFFRFLVAPVFLRRAIPGRLGLRSDSGDEYVAEHAPSSPLARRLLSRLSSSELRRIRSGRKLRTGTSCIIVARAGR